MEPAAREYTAPSKAAAKALERYSAEMDSVSERTLRAPSEPHCTRRGRAV